MAENYIVCSGDDAIIYSVTVFTFTGTSEQYESAVFENNWYYDRWRRQIKITLDKPAHASFTINWLVSYLQCFNSWSPEFPFGFNEECNASWIYPTITFPAGVQEAYVWVTDKVFQSDTPTYIDRHYLYEYTYEGSAFLVPQAVIPDCGGAPPGCIMDISTYSGTTPSQRGIADGTIYAMVTGQTGSTITWRIDGVTDTGSTATWITFSNLEGGKTYSIRAEDGQCWDQIQYPLGYGDFRSGDFGVIEPMSNNNIVAVENPIILTLGTAINSIFPEYSVNTFTINGSISDVTIDFDLTFPYSYTGQFLSKGYPDRSNYFLESILTDEIGTPQGTNTAEEIATSLAEVFQKDAIIGRLYYITSASNVVTLKAKEYGNEYDLSSSNVTITGSNLSLSNTTGGIAEFDGQLVENYSLYCELFVNENIEYNDTPDALDFIRVQELELPFNKTNEHQFDLSPILKNFVNSPKIDFNFTGVTYMSEMIASYYCKYGEKYPLIPNSNTKKKRYKGTTDFGFFINSSLPYENQNSMNDYFGTSDVLFLNTAPNTKYSHRDSKEFLNIVIPIDYAYPLELFGNIYLYDGSASYNVNLLTITNGLNFGGVAMIQSGYDALGLEPYESGGVKIRKVELQVYQNSGGYIPYSEVKSYLFEIDEQPDNFNIAFLNKLGTYETFTFIGELVENQEINRDSFQKPYNIGSKGEASLGFEYNSISETRYIKKYVLNTGIIDSDTFDYVMGILQSNKIYHYDHEHQNYLRVVSHTANKSTNDNEYSVQIVVEETINVNNVES